MTKIDNEAVDPQEKKSTVKTAVRERDLFPRIQKLDGIKDAPRSVKRNLLKKVKKARKKALR